MRTKLTKNNTSVTSNNSYSQALFELASENNVLLEVEDQTSALLKLIKSSPENYKFEGNDKLKINKIFSDKLSKINFLEQFFNEIILSDAA